MEKAPLTAKEVGDHFKSVHKKKLAENEAKSFVKKVKRVEEETKEKGEEEYAAATVVPVEEEGPLVNTVSF